MVGVRHHNSKDKEGFNHIIVRDKYYILMFSKRRTVVEECSGTAGHKPIA